MSERSVSMKITSKKHKAIESKTLRDLIGSLSLYNFFFRSLLLAALCHGRQALK